MRLVGVSMGLCRAVPVMGVRFLLRVARSRMYMERILLFAAAVVTHGGDGIVGSGVGCLDLTQVQVSSCAQQLQGPAALRTSKIKVIEFEFAADGAVKATGLGF